MLLKSPGWQTAVQRTTKTAALRSTQTAVQRTTQKAAGALRSLRSALLIGSTLTVFLVWANRVQAQASVTITCDSLFKMPFVGFNPDRLPDGFLACFGGHEADIPMMKKWALLLSSNQGDDYTVGDMKRVLDSVDRATPYRKTASVMEACRAVYRQPLRPDFWFEDSLAMNQCGANPRMLHAMGNMVRAGKTQPGWTLAALSAAYEKNLPELLKLEAENHSLHCGTAPIRPFSFGLKTYDDLPAALACAQKIEKPVLLFFASWMNNVTRRTEDLTLRELDLFTRLNRETIQLLLYADDPTPLPPDRQYMGMAEDTLISTQGAQAVELAYRYLQIKHPPGMVLLHPDGSVLYSKIGEPTRDDLFLVLELAQKLEAAGKREKTD